MRFMRFNVAKVSIIRHLAIKILLEGHFFMIFFMIFFHDFWILTDL